MNKGITGLIAALTLVTTTPVVADDQHDAIRKQISARATADQITNEVALDSMLEARGLDPADHEYDIDVDDETGFVEVEVEEKSVFDAMSETAGRALEAVQDTASRTYDAVADGLNHVFGSADSEETRLEEKEMQRKNQGARS